MPRARVWAVVVGSLLVLQLLWYRNRTGSWFGFTPRQTRPDTAPSTTAPPSAAPAAPAATATPAAPIPPAAPAAPATPAAPITPAAPEAKPLSPGTLLSKGLQLKPGQEQVVTYPNGIKEPQGSGSWKLSFKARCLVDPGPSAKQILAHVGGSQKWRGAHVGYDGHHARFFIDAQDYTLLGAQALDCTKERLVSLVYEGTVLSLHLDSETAMTARDVPLFLEPTTGIRVGRASTSQDDAEWSLSDVEMVVPPVKNVLEETDEEVASYIEQAKQQWAQQLAKDPLEGVPKRSLIESVCNNVEDEEERWMCKRRGRRMAERFEKYWYNESVPVSRAESDTLVRHPVYEGGVRFSVVNGKVKSFGEYGGKGLKVYYNSILPWVADLARNNVFKEGQTFDFVVRYGDGCQAGWDANANIKEVEFTYPTVGYSHSNLACPFREPLDWLFFIQESGWLKPKSRTAWEKLTTQSVWKGGMNNPYRVQLLDGVSRIPEFQGSGGSYIFPECRSWAKLPALRLRNTPEKLCRKAAMTSWTHQENQKYHINIDGYGTTLRTMDLLRVPGVLFSTHNRGFVMGWEYDLIPWLHFIPLEANNIQDSLLRRFQWAKSHDSAAKEISAEATRWYEKHGVKAPLYRMWELYAVFMADLWKQKAGGTVPEPPPLSQKPSSGALTCDNVGRYCPGSKTALRLQCNAGRQVRTTPRVPRRNGMNLSPLRRGGR